MGSVTPLRPPSIMPPGNGVQLVAAVLRCKACKAEWKGALDGFCRVERADCRCPRCSSQTPPEAA